MAKPTRRVEQDERPLHVRLRPQSFDDVIGQDAVVKSLAALPGKDGRLSVHTFLFSGPSGVGKTTLARILASAAGCDDSNLIEIDAAKYSGVDDMRSITGLMQYQGFGESGVRFVIVDECHRLSRQTWDTLLKATEEPLPHVYWCFCTTEAEKVPKTIITRCHSYELKPVAKDLLTAYLEYFSKEEDIEVPLDAIAYIADKADGSVRQALVLLSAARGCSTRKEVHELLSTIEENPEVIDLVRSIVDGRGMQGSWQGITATLSKLQETTNAESIRIVTVNYVGAALMKSPDGKKVARLLTILQAFSEPYRQSEKFAPLLLSIGRVMYGGE